MDCSTGYSDLGKWTCFPIDLEAGVECIPSCKWRDKANRKYLALRAESCDLQSCRQTQAEKGRK